MTPKNFQFSFTSSKNPELLYPILLDVSQWWNGLFGEIIEGKSVELNDIFTFKAGNGVHQSTHKLIELTPNKKMVWLVTESNLSFLTHTDEWNNTKFGFDLKKENNLTTVTFTHQGLIPEIECYGRCTNAWTQYLEKLAAKLND